MSEATLAEEQSSTEVSSSKTVTLRIAKFNPEHDSGQQFVDFKVPYERWTTVLDAVLYKNFRAKLGCCNSRANEQLSDCQRLGGKTRQNV